jgi:hypothetical protein
MLEVALRHRFEASAWRAARRDDGFALDLSFASPEAGGVQDGK